jgi:hypothetical protein
MPIERLAAGIADTIRHPLAARIVDIGDHHLGAFARQCRRAGRPDPRGAAGHDRHLALDLPHHVLPCR